MNEKELQECKKALYLQLSYYNIRTLRTYGREIQLKTPTKSSKEELVQNIIAVICGEIQPNRSKRGAPVRREFKNPEIHEQVRLLCKAFGHTAPPLAYNSIKTEEPNAESKTEQNSSEIVPIEQEIVNPSQQEKAEFHLRLTPEQKSLLHQLIDTF